MSGLFVDVWHGDILLKESDEQNYWLLLSDNEKEKAVTYTRPELQKKYIKVQGVLRKILASYLDIEPQGIIIKTGDHGKPYLTEGTIDFNLSHSGNRFVLAVGNIGSMGVDLEQHRERKNLSGLVEKCFSENEKSYWYSLAKQQQTRMFYHFWVRKEAFVKAVGRGIALGLDQCVINPENQTCFLSIPENYGVVSDWKIMEIQLKEKDICAIVTRNMEAEFKLQVQRF